MRMKVEVMYAGRMLRHLHPASTFQCTEEAGSALEVERRRKGQGMAKARGDEWR
jgi:hypothetical protein